MYQFARFAGIMVSYYHKFQVFNGCGKFYCTIFYILISDNQNILFLVSDDDDTDDTGTDGNGRTDDGKHLIYEYLNLSCILVFLRPNFHLGFIVIIFLDMTPSGNSGTKTTVSTFTDTNRTISGSSITQSIIMTGSIDSTSSIATPSENDMHASSKEELVTKLPGKLKIDD